MLRKILKSLDFWFNPKHLFNRSQFNKGYSAVRGKQMDAIGSAMQRQYARKQKKKKR